MKESERQAFIEFLVACGEIYNREVKTGQIALFWEATKNFSLPEVSRAFNKHVVTSKFFPTPADIIEKIPRAKYSCHIGADEAWQAALLSMDEGATVIVNEEIMKAREIAMDIYNSGDKVGARMAFRDAYNRVCLENDKPRWFVSLGHDKGAREGVVMKALEAGLIGHEKAQWFLPHIEVPLPKKELKLVS